MQSKQDKYLLNNSKTSQTEKQTNGIWTTLLALGLAVVVIGVLAI
ncbi:MAG: hypothetical protein MAGBODY4_00935 [Candidatus Marinimicrobia bacterium]|nr:hypothetical protein [Candidatus Neomarinimicrobiota bacterium]